MRQQVAWSSDLGRAFKLIARSRCIGFGVQSFAARAAASRRQARARRDDSAGECGNAGSRNCSVPTTTAPRRFSSRSNTPGGLVDSMRTMAGAILSSRVPVIIYVAPAGARAGSAGFFLLEAADIAAMAPGTNAGAAHVVFEGGKPDET